MGELAADGHAAAHAHEARLLVLLPVDLDKAFEADPHHAKRGAWLAGDRRAAVLAWIDVAEHEARNRLMRMRGKLLAVEIHDDLARAVDKQAIQGKMGGCGLVLLRHGGKLDCDFPLRKFH